MPRIFRSESPYGGSPHVFIATAAYQFHPNYTHSLAAAMPALREAGIAVDLCHVADDCHVDDARNAMVRQFLMSKATDLVFIDNDVGFDRESLVKLCKHDRDIVAGVYPCKDDNELYPVRPFDNVELWAEADGLVEVAGLPTGFMKIKRHVLERMTALEPRKYYGRGQSQDSIPHTILFERTYEDGTRFSGDYAFCEKWRKLGGKLYVDPEMRFTHSGTKEWSGTLGDYWRRTHGVVQARFDLAIQRLKDGRMDAETALWLREGWGNPFSGSPELLITAWHASKKAEVAVLEAGSGLTTLVMALANPVVTVHALESEPLWGQKTLEACRKYNIRNVELSYCGLRDGWYATIPPKADVVLLDGPNRKVGDRTKAFLEWDLLSAHVLIDDADDSVIVEAAKSWAKKHGRPFSVLGKSFAISTR